MVPDIKSETAMPKTNDAALAAFIARKAEIDAALDRVCAPRDGGLDGSSVTCLLVGAQTWQRQWVRYEMLKSLARGNGILGVRIHDVGFAPREQSNALACLLAPQPAALASEELV